VEKCQNIARNPVKRDIRGFKIWANWGDLRARRGDARRINAGKRSKGGRKSKISMEIVPVFVWK
jgi:hypothetical protein